MITPEDVKKRACKIWDSGRFLSAWCRGENIFPIEFPAGSIKGSSLSENFTSAGKWISELVAKSKEKTGTGYRVEFTSVSHRQLGNQMLPQRVIIETPDDLLSICGTGNEFESFRKLYSATERALPSILPFIQSHPIVIISYMNDWEKIISVCGFLLGNPKPGIYIRQITIPGVDTKFIERNRRIIAQLMIFLRPDIYGDSPVELAGSSFEKRFGLLYDEPLIRFRILDPGLCINSLSDLTLTVTEFQSLNIPAEKIFITENKINGLSFPDMKSAIVIFGLGYGVKVLESIEWLKNRCIFYWGDIDTHGFSILSAVRSFLPQCRSILMDEETFLSHRDSWVEESESKRFTGELTGLSEPERELFENLKSNRFGINLRLEQELISYNALLDILKTLN